MQKAAQAPVSAMLNPTEEIPVIGLIQPQTTVNVETETTVAERLVFRNLLLVISTRSPIAIAVGITPN